MRYPCVIYGSRVNSVQHQGRSVVGALSRQLRCKYNQICSVGGLGGSERVLKKVKPHGYPTLWVGADRRSHRPTPTSMKLDGSRGQTQANGVRGLPLQTERRDLP